MNDSQSTERRIVVGVDGSPPSRAALARAVHQADLTGNSVDAVITWEYPSLYGWAAPMEDSAFAELVGKVLAEAVRKVVGDDPRTEVRETVALGNAAQVLLETERGAALLVVGSRGQHATCPVVITRGLTS